MEKIKQGLNEISKRKEEIFLGGLIILGLIGAGFEIYRNNNQPSLVDGKKGQEQLVPKPRIDLSQSLYDPYGW